MIQVLPPAQIDNTPRFSVHKYLFRPIPKGLRAITLLRLMMNTFAAIPDIPLNELLVLLFILAIVYGFAWHDRPAK